MGADRASHAGSKAFGSAARDLVGTHRVKSYQQVKINRYTYDQGEPLSSVKYAVLQAIRRLKDVAPQEGWSLAVLLSSRRFMLTVSAYLSAESDRLPVIPHDVLLDPEGPALAAVVIAGLLECGTSADDVADRLIGDLIAQMRGRNGGTPSQSDLRLSSVLGEYRRSGVVRGSARQALIQNIRQIAVARLALDLSGDPVEDWLEVRRLLLTAEHVKLRIVGDDARFLRLLNRGTLLQDSLAAQWRTNGDYRGAGNIVDAALRQEHFSASNRSWVGVNLMTLHKSKGKEFDEVVIFEGSRRVDLFETARPRGIWLRRVLLFELESRVPSPGPQL